MARGWESKSVESQIEAAEHQTVNGPRLTPEELTAARERESLLLSRTRVLNDLQNASNPRYRELLRRSPQFLDEKLAEQSTNRQGPRE